jgi:hypothetical protein
MSQIISVGASLGMVLGLGEPISKKFFDAPGYENMLFLVLPLINLYLFMRFGNLASAFSEARFSAEALATRYFSQCHIDKMSFEKEMTFVKEIRPSIMFHTNSYFEYFHHRGSGLFVILVFLYSLFVPALFSVSHAVSLYLLLKFVGTTPGGYIIAVLYCLPIIGLYIAYYRANRSNAFVYSVGSFSYLILSITFIFIVTSLLLYSFFQFAGTLHLGGTRSL